MKETKVMQVTASQDPATWPGSMLPRFAESARVFIEYPEWSHQRMLTGDWFSDAMWPKVIEDYCPRLAKAGALGFIASTVPWLAHGNVREYYGMANPPTVFWHWIDGRWEAQQNREGIARYCDYRKTTVDVFDTPRGKPVPWRVSV